MAFTITKNGTGVLVSPETGNERQFNFPATTLQKFGGKIKLLENGTEVFTLPAPADVTTDPPHGQTTVDGLFDYLLDEANNLFFFSSSVTLPSYANSTTVNAMFRGVTLPDIEADIDGPGTTPNPLVRFELLFVDTVSPLNSGIYFTINGDDWIRDADFDTGAELNQLHVHVNDGDVFGGTDWFQSEATPDVGVDPITFIPAAVMVTGQAAGYESHAIIIGDNLATDFTIRHLHNQQAGLWVAGWVGSDFTDVDDLATIRQRPTADTVSLAFTAALGLGDRVVVRLRSCTIPA